jgi:hypothetical protein
MVARYVDTTVLSAPQMRAVVVCTSKCSMQWLLSLTAATTGITVHVCSLLILQPLTHYRWISAAAAV